MQQALESIFNLIESNIITPIQSALENSKVFDNIFIHILALLQNIFRMWNNDNVSIENDYTSLIRTFSEIIGLLVFIFAFYVVLKMLWTITKSIYGMIGGK